MKSNFFKNFLEIHLNSQRGTIGRTFTLSYFRILIILLVSIFFILYTIVGIIINRVDLDDINQYVQNKIDKNNTSDSLSINFINPIKSDLFIISKSLNKKHNGLDIVVEKGTLVYSSLAGKILYSGFDRTYGNAILISHKNNFYTFYGHLDTILTESHKFVNTGEIIGKVGETGYSTGPHLHFEIWDEWGIKDPRIFIKNLEGRDVTQ